MSSFIYLLKPRACINANESVYKLGKTTNFSKRIFGYDKGSDTVLVLSVCDAFERTLLAEFIRQPEFTRRTDYGNEYFEGEVSAMISVIMEQFSANNMCYSVATIPNNTNANTLINNRDPRFIKKRNDLIKILNKVNKQNMDLFYNSYCDVCSGLRNCGTPVDVQLSGLMGELINDSFSHWIQLSRNL